MDMPAIISEYFPGISVESISEAVEDYQPAWQVIQHTWSNETLKEIMQGKVSVPDSVINEAIAESLKAESGGSEAADGGPGPGAEPPVTELKAGWNFPAPLRSLCTTRRILM